MHHGRTYKGLTPIFYLPRYNKEIRNNLWEKIFPICNSPIHKGVSNLRGTKGV